jgi:SAM-dependent methyltransferase
MRGSGAERVPVGLVYRSPRLYRLAMRILDPSSPDDLRVVAAAVEPGSSVLDLCCGDAALGPLLLEKGCSYVGLELNDRFVEAARRRGLDVREWDGRSLQIPSDADVVCILSSLYQFIPNERLLVAEMLRRARRKVIVSEPVRNWTTSDSALLRRVARTLTHVNGRSFDQRLDEQALRSLFAGTDGVETEFVRRPRQLICIATREVVRG